MAIRNYGVNDAETVKLWSKELAREAYDQFHFRGLVGEDPLSAFQIKPETSKGAGDKVTFTLVGNLSQEGVQGDGQVEGNEESITTTTDGVFVDSLDFAVRIPGQGTISRQRVPYDLRATAKDLLAEHWRERMEYSAIYQLAGYTATSDAAGEPLGSNVKYSGLNATVAPSAGRILRPNSVANDESLSTSDGFTLALLDIAVNRAGKIDSNGNPRIRKAKIKGYPQRLNVCVVHDDQWYQLRSDAQQVGNWFDLHLAAIQGGEISENPIFTGEDKFIYNGTLVMKSNYVPQGVHSSTSAAVANTRRAVFFGAQALAVAYGQTTSGGQMQWTEELFNYQKEFGVDAHMIMGMKKTQFAGKDFAAIAISTYAPAP